MKFTIPFTSIDRLEIYIASCSKSAQQVRLATNADYVINAGLFNMTTKQPVKYLKANGKVLSCGAVNEYGLAWSKPTGIVMTNGSGFNGYDNAINCIALLKDGTKQSLSSIDSALDGKRGRTAIGITKDSLVLYCVKDGTSEAMTPTQLQTAMANLGCKSALMLDGGGSSQCSTANNNIAVNRKVHNYICVYLKHDTKTTYPIPTVTLQKGSKGDTVKWVQNQLNLWYGTKKLTVDGDFGSKTVTAVKEFQKAKKLVADGIVGHKTIATLKGVV